MVPVEGKVKVAFTLGEPPLSKTHYAIFLVVKLSLSYNVILGRPMLYDFEVVTSIRYLTKKFPTNGGSELFRGGRKRPELYTRTQ